MGVSSRRFGVSLRVSSILGVVATIAASLALSVASAVVTASPAAATPAPPSPRFIGADADWLTTLNYDRAIAGLPPVTEVEDWSDGATLHSQYMASTGIQSHSEDPASQYYTASGNATGQASNIAMSSTPRTDRYWMDLWMRAPFHGVQDLRPGLTQSGFGSYTAGGRSAATSDVWRGTTSTTVANPVMWPGPGSTVTHTQWSGSEYPNPLTSCPGYGASGGLPIYLLLPEAPQVSSFTVSTGGTPIEVCEIDATNYTNPDAQAQQLARSILSHPHAVVLMPKFALIPGQTYDVAVETGTSVGLESWSFMVAGPRQVDIALSPSSNPHPQGTALTLTARVLRGIGTAMPTGTVTFYDGSTTLGTSSVDGAGTAELTVSTSWSPGNHTIKAVYGGDSLYDGVETTFVLNLQKPSSATLTVSDDSILVGESVTLTASIGTFGCSIAASGQVTFLSDGQPVATAPVNTTTNQASATVVLAGGAHAITARYGGNATYFPSTSAPHTVTVDAVDTSTAVVASPNPSYESQNVLLTATITAPANVSGTVAFEIDGQVVRTAAVTDNQAAAFVEGLAVGLHSVVARYSGDFINESSEGLTNAVVEPAREVNISLLAPEQWLAGRDAPLQAVVTDSSGNPINLGQVSFRSAAAENGGPVGSTIELGTVVLDSNGNAYLVAPFAEGCYSVTAYYPGGDGYSPASATAVVCAAGYQWPADGSGQFGLANPAVSGPEPCLAADPVNCFNGNFTETITDLAVAEAGSGLAFSRSYNALAAPNDLTAAPLGLGWEGSYSAHLSFSEAGRVAVHHDNGSSIEFVAAGDEYLAGAAVTATLVEDADGTFTYRLADQQVLRFDSDGRLTAQVDRVGNEISLSYTGAELTRIEGPGGRALTLGYSATGMLDSVADGAGHAVTYDYDATGRLTSVTDPTGSTTAYGYDSQHRLTTVTDPRGGITSNTYDASDRVLTQTDPLGRVTRFAYSGTTTTVTDPTGSVSVKEFDDNGNLLTRTVAAGTAVEATWTHAYDSANNRTSTTDPNGHVVARSFDARGNALSVTDALGRVTRFTYNARNQPVTITDATGKVTRLFYSPTGEPTEISRRLTPTQDVTQAYTYDPNHPGDVAGVRDPRGHNWANTYTAAGDLATTVDPAGGTTTLTYDTVGRLTEVVSPRGNEAGALPSDFNSSFTYDAAGRALSATDPLGHVTRFAYDAAGNRTSVTDPDGHVTTSAYDAAGQLTAVTRPDGTVERTSYDPAGRMATQTDGLGRITRYAYDAQGRLASISDPLGRVRRNGYDAAGNMVSRTDPTGHTTDFSYDAADQPTGIQYHDAATPDVTFTYDSLGRRLTMTDGTGTTTYAYDALGRATSVTDGAGRTTAYTYDHADNVIGIDYPDMLINASTTGVSASTTGLSVGAGRVTREYDPNGRLSSVTDWSAHTTRFGYDADGNHTTTTYANGVTATSTYDNASRLTRSLHSDFNGVPLLDLPYTYNASGDVATASTSGTPAGTTAAYTYDLSDRLTEAAQPAGPLNVPTQSYGYDAANNLTRITLAQVSRAFAYDNAHQLVRSSEPLTGQVDTTYTYDSNGNRTREVDRAGRTTTFTYDRANRLIGYAGPPINAINKPVGTDVRLAYSYNGDGLRADLTWDTVTGPYPTVMADLEGGRTFITGPDGLPLEQITANGTPIYYHHDQLGSTRLLTDNEGRPLTTYTYDPYGNSTASGTSVYNPFQYAGQYVDLPSGLIYMRARFYDPATGQFLTRDPLESVTREPYGYVGGNPINNTDPTGLICLGDLCTDGVTDALGDAWDNGYEWSKDHLDEVSDVASYVSFLGYAVCPVAAVGCVVGQVGSWVSAGSAAGYAALNCGSSLDANCASSLISMNVAAGGVLPSGWIANAAYDFGVTFPWMMLSRGVLPTLGDC